MLLDRIKNMRKSTRNDLITYGIVVGFYLVVQLFTTLGLLSSAFIGQLIPICAYVILAVSLNLTVGFLGELSLGHAGFMSIGAFAGVVVGITFGSMPFLAKVFDPLILGLYSLPKIALAPLFIIWFGLDMLPKIVLASVTVFFLVFFSTLSGVRDVDRQLIDVVLVMGSSRKDILTKVIVPSALSWIFGGLKISIPYAMVGAVTGELMASNKGMGFLIQGSAAYFDTAGVFAGLLALMIVTSILNEVLIRVESRLMRWRRAGSGQVGL